MLIKSSKITEMMVEKYKILPSEKIKIIQLGFSFEQANDVAVCNLEDSD